jgi:heptosyltransferase-2
MATPKSIALIAPNWLGDAVMSLPLVGMMAASGDVSLAVVAPESTARVYWDLDGVDELVVLPKRGFTRGMASRSRHLRKARPDAVVLLPPSLSSAVAPWLAAVPVRVGYQTDGRGAFLTDAVSAESARDEHLTKNYLSLGEMALRRLGVRRPESFDTPAVRLAAGDEDELQRILAAKQVPQRYIVVVPGATYGPAKSWPWRRYRAVAHGLSEETAVALAGSAQERDKCERIAEGANNVFNLSGETSMGTFLALLSGASAVLANDSGSPHLAASMGRPVVVLFGSTSPVWTAPAGPSVDIVHRPVACSPCFRKTCPTELECFEGIGVEDVIERTRRAMTKPVRGTPRGGEVRCGPTG